ncbi:hypothetical protein LR48_Vigan05g143100 [Vigna angularis]|uniref:TIR domain-containing protein n=1 Tax=Phaseolus angularis TaxID=3914 RepID=A0A0L9UM87_PHAAN|nr:hypothetical protein LR48_Vigan05g143100 [Vigna angularis]
MPKKKSGRRWFWSHFCGRSSSSDVISSVSTSSTYHSSDTIQNQDYRYDVFISFRGPDTRNSFVDHLHSHLLRKGIFVFKDDRKLRKGESISSQLPQAIRGSRISIINGVYEKAFVSLRQKFKGKPDKVYRWERAMNWFGTLAGWDVRNRSESEVIEDIVQTVIKNLGHKFSWFVDDLIGIQPRVQALEDKLRLSSNSDVVQVLGIWGMNGIGKTTHAAVLYDKISHRFDASCFIEDVSKLYRDGGHTALRVLHLSGCSRRESSPDFTRTTHLEYLDMDECTSLSTIHESIGVLSSLTFLGLRGCTKLISIPNDINSLVSLQTLYLCRCFKLTNLLPRQASKSHLECLIFLDLSFCNLLEVPDAIGELRCLERLNLQGNNFVSIPDSFRVLHCLAYINLSHCHELKSLSNLPFEGAASGGKYFRAVSGSRDHRSGLYLFNCIKMVDILSKPWDCWSLELAWLFRLIKVHIVLPSLCLFG